MFSYPNIQNDATLLRCYNPTCARRFKDDNARASHVDRKPDCYAFYREHLDALRSAALPSWETHYSAIPTSSTTPFEPQPGAPALLQVSITEHELIDSPFDIEYNILNAILSERSDILNSLEPPQHENTPVSPPFTPSLSVDHMDSEMVDGLPEVPQPEANPLLELPNGHVYERVHRAGEKIQPCTPIFVSKRNSIDARNNPPWSPFATEGEWELAKWLVEYGITASATDDFLKLPIISACINPALSTRYHFREALKSLPDGAAWSKMLITVEGDKLDKDNKRLTRVSELWLRNPVDVVKGLLARHDLRDELVFEPRITYTDRTKRNRVYMEMWTGDWWAEIQKLLPPGSTLIPLILSSDKTHLTNFSGNKKAWPVYLTIGNIPKSIRRKTSACATILVGYLPIPPTDISRSEASQQELAHWLFHTCMDEILRPMILVAREGIEIECADGWTRNCYLTLGAYVADHPEQCLIVCCKQNHCPRCHVDPTMLQDDELSEPRCPKKTTSHLRAQAKGLRATGFDEDGNGLKPVARKPFWSDIPYCNIFTAIAPDLLHQLHRGVFKDHIFEWCLSLAKLVKMEDLINERFKSMPAHRNTGHFANGVLKLGPTSGKEHKSMEKVFVAVVSGIVPERVLHAVRAFIDFAMYASYRTHTTSTLAQMEEALTRWHDNKDAFVEFGVRDDLNIPKVHSMVHYAHSVRSLGSLDGYNTEAFERLHIEFAKKAYRATNHKDYLPQMTAWLARKEAVWTQDLFLRWAYPKSITHTGESTPAEPSNKQDLDDTHLARSGSNTLVTTNGAQFLLAKAPHYPRTTQQFIHDRFGAKDFLPALQSALRQYHPSSTLIPADTDTFNCYARAKIQFNPLSEPFADQETLDVISVFPSKVEDDRASEVTAVLINQWPQDEIGFQLGNHRVAVVRVIFSLPKRYQISEMFVYIEYFSDPDCDFDEATGMYRISRRMLASKRVGKIVPLSNIWRSCHLVPDFTNRVVECSTHMIDTCDAFFINPYIDNHVFRALHQEQGVPLAI